MWKTSQMEGTPEEKKHMTACLEFAEIHVNFFDMSHKIMWSDLTKIEYLS